MFQIILNSSVTFNTSYLMTRCMFKCFLYVAFNHFLYFVASIFSFIGGRSQGSGRKPPSTSMYLVNSITQIQVLHDIRSSGCDTVPYCLKDNCYNYNIDVRPQPLKYLPAPTHKFEGIQQITPPQQQDIIWFLRLILVKRGHFLFKTILNIGYATTMSI